MTAIIEPTLQPEPRITPRPPLRVLEGGRSPRQLARYRRRRVVAAMIVIAVAGVTTVGVRAALPILRPTVPGAHPVGPAGTAGAAGGASVVVRQGDTLWSIARRLAPEGDVRAAVDRLADVHGTGPLHIGERLPLTAVKGG